MFKGLKDKISKDSQIVHTTNERKLLVAIVTLEFLTLWQ